MPGKCLPKHKFFRMTAVLLTAVLCAGCLGACNSAPPSGEFSSPVKSGNFEPAKSGGPGNTAMVVPKHLTVQLEENLSIDADISFRAAGIYNTYRAELLHLDVDTISSLLINDPITNESRSDYESGGFVYNAETASGGYLSLECGVRYQMLHYWSGWAEDILHLVKVYPKESVANWADCDTRNQLPQGIDLSFASIDEALADVTAVLQPLKIELTEDFEIYSLTAETLQALADDYAGSSKPGSDDTIKNTWSSDDECYYMVLRSGYNEIPLSTHTDMTNIIFGTTIYVCYNKDGIQYLRLDQPYSILEIAQESKSVISLEQLQEAIQEKYSMVILTDPVTITGIEFCYRAFPQSTDGEYLLEPTWMIEIEQSIPVTDTDNWVMYSYVGFDAITGKEQ